MTSVGPTAASDEVRAVAERITAAITTGFPPARFEELALALFHAQRAQVPVYGAWVAADLRRTGRTPADVRRWRDVPALPIQAFKQARVAAHGAGTALPDVLDAACWRSSGTDGERSSHPLRSLAAYDASLLAGVQAALKPSRTLACVQLHPSREAAPDSSLSHMLDAIRASCDDAGAWVDGRYRLDVDGAWRALMRRASVGQPVLLVATSFALLELLRGTSDERALRLPEGSRVVDTGGFKGRSGETTRAELALLVTERLGVDEDLFENEYGMSELSSQAWIGNVAARLGTPLTTHGAGRWMPPWLRMRVVDPVTLSEVPDGSTGLLVFHDLANVWSCAVVRTEDVGVRRGSSFEPLGRATGSALKGCSLRFEDVFRDHAAR